jgi:septum site-determining protein MinC
MSTIKNQYFSTFVYQLTTMDLKELRKDLDKKIKAAPDLLVQCPFILDFSGITKYEDFDLFFNEIKNIFLSFNIYFIGVSNINERFNEQCIKHNVAILHSNKVKRSGASQCPKYDFHQGVMRSGQTIYVPDNGIVYNGLVKNDAEISADGDIIITGTLSGKAFAGFNGNREAKIIVTNYRPFLVSIAGYAFHYEAPDSFFGRAVMVSLRDDNSLKVELI